MVMRETPIAFGLTMVICLALFFYCWYIKKLRSRLVSVQVSATPDDPPVRHEKTGIQKEVMDSFPTVKTSELKVNIKDELQCSICLVDYNDTETLRKLPYCGHVFHIPCVDSWLENQVTCPVCRIELTDTVRNQAKQRSSSYQTQASTPTSVTIDIAQSRHVATPAWVLVNRPFPLPPATAASGSPNPKVGPESEVGFETHLPGSRNPHVGGRGLPEVGDEEGMPGWGAIFLQKTGFSFRSLTADMAIIESKDCISHSSISKRWMTESFSFGSSATAGGGTDDGGATTTRRAAESAQADVASEIYRRSPQHGHLPLTVSPEHCAFEFLPIVAVL